MNPPPAPQAHAASNNGEKPINLFQFECLFVIRSSYWSCRIGNEPRDFHLSPHKVESRARDRLEAYPSQSPIHLTHALRRAKTRANELGL